MKKPKKPEKQAKTVYVWKTPEGMGLPVVIDFELGFWVVAKGVDFRKSPGGELRKDYAVYHKKLGRCAPFYFPDQEMATQACRMLHDLKDNWDVPLSEFEASGDLLKPFCEKYKEFHFNLRR